MRGLRPLYPLVSVVSLPAILLLLGCVRLGDRLTGVEVRGQQTATCIRECNQQFNEDLGVANDNLKARLEACQLLPEEGRSDCHQAASAEFEAKVEELNQARRACIDGCHRQGSGSGS